MNLQAEETNNKLSFIFEILNFIMGIIKMLMGVGTEGGESVF